MPLPLSCRSTPGGRPFSLMAGGGLPVATTSPQLVIGWPTTAVRHEGSWTNAGGGTLVVVVVALVVVVVVVVGTVDVVVVALVVVVVGEDVVVVGGG